MKRPVYLSQQVSAPNQRHIVRLVGELQAFKVGSVKASWFPTSLAVPTGMLSDGWARQLRAVGNGDRPVYVVFSYSTPIAWRGAGLDWVAPQVKYSPTTTHHQSLVAQGMRAWTERCDAAVRQVAP
jgi:hypothetical protein